MARPILKTLGGKPKLVSVFGRDWRNGTLPLLRARHTVWTRYGTELTCGGPLCGELSSNT